VSGSGAEDQLSDLSLNYLAGRPKVERSPIGQFLTPRVLREALVSRVQIEDGMRVLDPGVGTGEFLQTCYEVANGAYLEGWDIDAQVTDVARQLVPSAEIKLQSALDQPWKEDFDVVIGNPPYFEIRKMDPRLRARYRSVIGGRPNIFSLFFAAGLGALKPDGVLGFVVPPSMNNGAYFSKLRDHISTIASIEHLEVFSDSRLFVDAQTAVQLIVLRKGRVSRRHIVDLGKLAKSPKQRTVFAEDSHSVSNEFRGRTSLWNLGYEAVTGSTVWNLNKVNLRSVPDRTTVPLIWAHNITSSEAVVLNLENSKKPQYIVSSEMWKGPAIVVNRITGSVGQGSLRCAMVPSGTKYLAENHINVIKPRANTPQRVDWPELLALLRGPGINARIQRLTGNTQVSSVELTHFLPLDFESKNLENGMLF